MRWLGVPVSILFCIGQVASAELFNFDLSSLRPDELCEPSEILRGPFSGGPFSGGETFNFCPVENHIKLFSADKTIFLQRIQQIRSASANRPVSLFIGENAQLIDATILAPIGKQIVAFTISEVSQHDLTSRLPAIGLANLLDLRFWHCEGLRIHKADFSGLKNIRAIEFRQAAPAFIEQGIFTDLPALQTLGLANDINAFNHPDRVAVYQQFKCDAKNAWLWEFLKGKPGLLKDRDVGDIFKLGNFTSTFLVVDPPNVNCVSISLSANRSA